MADVVLLDYLKMTNCPNKTGMAPIKLAYKAFEPTDGINEALPPVIFLHGIANSKEIWDDIPQKISNETKRKAYAYDARCHGESESSEHHSSDLNVDDLFHFMDGLNIDKAALVGHSMGGLTAIHAALRKPERVEMIFSEDMFVKKISDEIYESVIKYILIWNEAVQSIPKDLDEREALNLAVDIVFEKNEDSKMFSSKDGLKKSNLCLKRKDDGSYYLNYDKDPMIKALRDPETWLSKTNGVFNGKAYFIYGGNSPFSVGSDEANIKKYFPKAELIEFEGASHNVHTEFPDNFTQTILKRFQE